MTAYMVFEPPEDGNDALTRAERVVFVPDRFSWAAFLLGPLWMLRHRLWLVLLGYLVVLAALAAALHFAGVGSIGRYLILALFALLVGLESASLRRWTLLRRGWRERGTVIGDDRDMAERRFFDGFAARAAERKPAPPSPPLFGPGPGAPDVIGLFPQPGTPR
jgi:hypothetical protein